MHITSIDEHPFHTLRYSNVESHRQLVVAHWPIHRARASGFPKGLAAIVAASDLQGRELLEAGQPGPRLLGEVLAAELAALAQRDVIPPARETAVILAGDLFAETQVRGGLGDAGPVYLAFAGHVKQVVGVHGNHDLVGKSAMLEQAMRDRVQILDVGTTSIGDMTIGGVGGIIGSPHKPNRRTTEDFLAALQLVLTSKHRPEVMLMHQGPDMPAENLPGSTEVRECILQTQWTGLVMCGHKHWKNPIMAISPGVNVLNLDGRCVVIVPE